MGDWTTDAADAIDRSIAFLRERTVDPATAINQGRRVRAARGAHRDPRR